VYVCLCNVVTDHQIAEAIAQGATTVESVGRVCEAGTVCGGCHEEIEHLIAQVQGGLETAHAG
jgi:bacterioferritin-associated ferredoxin